MTCINIDPGFNKTDPSTTNIDPGFNKTDPSTETIDPGFNKEMPECPPQTETTNNEPQAVFWFNIKDPLKTTEKSQATLDKAATLQRQAEKFADQATCLKGKKLDLESDVVSEEQADLTCEVQAECANESEDACTAKTIEMLEQNNGDIGKQSAVLEGNRVGTAIREEKLLSRALDTAEKILRQLEEVPLFGNHDHGFFPFSGDLPDLGGLLFKGVPLESLTLPPMYEEDDVGE